MGGLGAEKAAHLIPRAIVLRLTADLHFAVGESIDSETLLRCMSPAVAHDISLHSRLGRYRSQSGRRATRTKQRLTMKTRPQMDVGSQRQPALHPEIEGAAAEAEALSRWPIVSSDVCCASQS